MMKERQQEAPPTTWVRRFLRTLKDLGEHPGATEETPLVTLDIDLAKGFATLFGILGLVATGLLFPYLMRGTIQNLLIWMAIPIISSALAAWLYVVSSRRTRKDQVIAHLLLTRRVRAKYSYDRAMQAEDLDQALVIHRREAIRKLTDVDPATAITGVEEITALGSEIPFPEGFDALVQQLAYSRDWALRLRIAEVLADVARPLHDTAKQQQEQGVADVH
jgi:hypothetical protein